VLTPLHRLLVARYATAGQRSSQAKMVRTKGGPFSFALVDWRSSRGSFPRRRDRPRQHRHADTRASRPRKSALRPLRERGEATPFCGALFGLEQLRQHRVTAHGQSSRPLCTRVPTIRSRPRRCASSSTSGVPKPAIWSSRSWPPGLYLAGGLPPRLLPDLKMAPSCGRSRKRPLCELSARSPSPRSSRSTRHSSVQQSMDLHERPRPRRPKSNHALCVWPPLRRRDGLRSTIRRIITALS
jgi:hypothetical protein